MQANENIVEVNTYNLNDRNFRYRDDLNDSNENSRNINGELRLNQNYINQNPNEQDENRNEPLQINNPIYYQQPPQKRGAGANERPDYPNSYPNENILRNNPNQTVDSKYEYYFNTKIRNTGYWGKVRLRRGTWMVIIGLFFTCIALTIISVFWAFWYHPAANIPCRVVGITMLVWSVFTVIFGLLSNWLMINDPLYKHLIGSPVRWSSWLLLVSTIAITIASVLITIYYTYWHNRWVNTPMIIIAINFYFFGGIAFIVSLYLTVKHFNIDVKTAKYGPQAIESGDEEEGGGEGEGESKDDEEYLREADDKVDELYASKNANPLNSSNLETGSNADSDTGKKDFRKKVTQLKPRNLINSSYQNVVNNSNVQNQSLNNTASVKN